MFFNSNWFLVAVVVAIAFAIVSVIVISIVVGVITAVTVCVAVAVTVVAVAVAVAVVAVGVADPFQHFFHFLHRGSLLRFLLCAHLKDFQQSVPHKVRLEFWWETLLVQLHNGSHPFRHKLVDFVRIHSIIWQVQC